MKKIFLIGAGGLGSVAADIAEEAGRQVVFVDDKFPEKEKHGVWTIEGNLESLSKLIVGDDEVFLSIGYNAIREKVFNQFSDLRFANLVHPAAVISKHADLSQGCLIIAGAVIRPFSNIGKCSIINACSTLGHDCQIGDFVHVAPGVNLGGNCKVGNGSWIGQGASVREGVCVGENSIVGSGAVVIKDVPDNVVVGGIPAKPISKKN